MSMNDSDSDFNLCGTNSVSLSFFLQMLLSSVSSRGSSQAAASRSRPPTAAWTWSAWPSASRPPRQAACWTRASWNAPAVRPPTPPAATGSCWRTSTSAWRETQPGRREPPSQSEGTAELWSIYLYYYHIIGGISRVTTFNHDFFFCKFNLFMKWKWIMTKETNGSVASQSGATGSQSTWLINLENSFCFLGFFSPPIKMQIGWSCAGHLIDAPPMLSQ